MPACKSDRNRYSEGDSIDSHNGEQLAVQPSSKMGAVESRLCKDDDDGKMTDIQAVAVFSKEPQKGRGENTLRHGFFMSSNGESYAHPEESTCQSKFERIHEQGRGVARTDSTPRVKNPAQQD